MRKCKLTDEQLAALAAAGYRYAEELLDRRAEAESDLRQMEQSIAYSSCVTLIESNCGGITGEEEFYDVNNVDPFAAEDVAEAVRYLDLRGLIQRLPDNAAHIAIRDESEATA